MFGKGKKEKAMNLFQTGSPPFDVEKTKTVSRVEIPRQGDRYAVFYDA